MASHSRKIVPFYGKYKNPYHGLNSGLDLGLMLKKKKKRKDSILVIGKLGIVRIKGDYI